MSELNEPYFRDGAWLVEGQRVAYSGMAIESRDKNYEVLLTSEGDVCYYINGRRVSGLPRTPLTKTLLREFSERQDEVRSRLAMNPLLKGMR
jgi:hypothetical protein